jgi:hypothetical protein
MEKKFYKDIEILKKWNWNPANEKLNKSNKKTQLKVSAVDCIKLKTEYQGLKTK